MRPDGSRPHEFLRTAVLAHGISEFKIVLKLQLSSRTGCPGRLYAWVLTDDDSYCHRRACVASDVQVGLNLATMNNALLFDRTLLQMFACDACGFSVTSRALDD